MLKMELQYTTEQEIGSVLAGCKGHRRVCVLPGKAAVEGQIPHLHMQAEERVVSKEAITAGSCYHVTAQRHVAVCILSLQQRRRPVQHLVHVTTHPIQWQVVCNLQSESKKWCRGCLMALLAATLLTGQYCSSLDTCKHCTARCSARRECSWAAGCR